NSYFILTGTVIFYVEVQICHLLRKLRQLMKRTCNSSRKEQHYYGAQDNHHTPNSHIEQIRNPGTFLQTFYRGSNQKFISVVQISIHIDRICNTGSIYSSLQNIILGRPENLLLSFKIEPQTKNQPVSHIFRILSKRYDQGSVFIQNDQGKIVFQKIVYKIPVRCQAAVVFHIIDHIISLKETLLSADRINSFQEKGIDQDYNHQKQRHHSNKGHCQPVPDGFSHKVLDKFHGLHLEFVAHAPDCLDILSFFPHFAPQFLYVSIDSPGIAEIIIIPH